MTDIKKSFVSKAGKNRAILFKITVYTALTLYLVWVIFPFIIILITSFVPLDEVAASMEFVMLPKTGYTLRAYNTVFVNDYLAIDGIPSLVRGFINTVWMTLPPVFAGLFVSGLAAYSYSKLRFRAKKAMYAVQISTIMLPMSVMTIPSYLMYDLIGWTHSPLPLMIPGMFGGAAMIFFFRQFFTSVPDELVEVAKLDGLGYFMIYLKIIIPIVKPAFIAQGIFAFVGGYNSYVGPLLYLDDEKLYTLQLIVYNFSTSYNMDYPVRCASAVVALTPLIILYVFCQRLFTEGIAATGIKG